MNIFAMRGTRKSLVVNSLNTGVAPGRTKGKKENGKQLVMKAIGKSIRAPLLLIVMTMMRHNLLLYVLFMVAGFLLNNAV